MRYMDDAEAPRETAVRALRREFSLEVSPDELHWISTSKGVELGVTCAVRDYGFIAKRKEHLECLTESCADTSVDGPLDSIYDLHLWRPLKWSAGRKELELLGQSSNARSATGGSDWTQHGAEQAT